jgi:hypothetical protein|tara:strand:- start:1345 stop:1548 length:204 start_codon:yes stop_codon:yes gene_type:complete
MMLTDKQIINLIEDMNKIIDNIDDLRQSLVNINHKINVTKHFMLKLAEHTNMPDMPCNPDDGSWVGR